MHRWRRGDGLLVVPLPARSRFRAAALEALLLKEKLLALTELQKVDLELASLKKSHEVFPKSLAEVEKELGAARSALEAERSRVADLERQRSSLEQTIAEEKDKVKKWEARLAEQRSTREYSALAREIDIAKKSNLNMADELVDLVKGLGTAREGLSAHEARFTEARGGLDARVAELKAKMAEAGSQVGELEAKRTRAQEGIEPRLLRRYDAIRKKKLPALAPLRGNTCTGCNMNVPPQLANTLRSTRGTDECPNCHRIIYQPEALEGDAPAAG